MEHPIRRNSITLWLATAISIAVLSVALTFVTNGIQRQAEAWQWVVHTREVLERLQFVLALTSSAESAQRGFLLSGSDAQLSSYREAATAVPKEIGPLLRLTVDNPGQQARIQELDRLTRERLAMLARVLELKRAEKPIELELIEAGRQQKEAIFTTAGAIRSEEQRLLQDRQDRVDRARQEVIVSVGTVFALTIGLLVLLRVLSERDAARLRAESEALRKAKDQLTEANLLLERRVQERTERISEANAELQAFAHTVAHDLRAPLRNAEGFATALLQDEAERMSDDGKLFAERIRAAIARMDRLITDLLAYSRLSRSELRLQAVDVDHVLEIVQHDLELQINASQAEVSVLSPLPTVLANEGVLIQVIQNLLSNALKFVAKGETPRVIISSRVAEGKASIFVADRGIGIAPSHRERVFGVFERLHGQEEYPGTGIGLAIVKKGVERMGGRVQMDSPPEGGTRFEIQLPVAETGASAEARNGD